MSNWNNKYGKEWQLLKLNEVCKVITGTTPSKADLNNYGNDIPFVKPPQLFDNIIKDASEKLSHKGASLARILPVNSVLITCIGNLGRTGINKIPVCFNQQINALIPSPHLNHQFLFYQAQSPNFQNQLKRLSAATTVAIVNKGKFETIKIVVPPLYIQTTIVSKIEELFSELDKGKQQLETVLQQLKVYRQSVLKWAFEGRLTNKDVKEGELPKGWKNLILKEVTKEISDGDHQAPPKSETGIHFITISNIGKNNKIDFSNTYKVKNEYYLKLKANRKPLKGDILYTVTGSFGIPVLIDFEKEFCFQRHIGLVRPLENIDQKWIYYLLQSPQVYKQAVETATGTAQKTVALNSLRNFIIPYCNIEEQYLIVQEIESRLSIADKLEESITKSIQQTEALRQSILKKAFEGKLVNADPKQNEESEPKKIYFHQVLLLFYIIHFSEKNGITHGEMTLAKYAYLLDRIFEIKTYYNYKRLHLGPYPPEMKKTIKNKKFFVVRNNQLQVVNAKEMTKYKFLYKDEAEEAIETLAEIFLPIRSKDRAHQTELIATVCKVIEDIQTMELKAVRKSMKEWKIDLKDGKFKNKAEKFSEKETEECLNFIKEKGWDKKLMEFNR